MKKTVKEVYNSLVEHELYKKSLNGKDYFDRYSNINNLGFYKELATYPLKRLAHTADIKQICDTYIYYMEDKIAISYDDFMNIVSANLSDIIAVCSAISCAINDDMETETQGE